MRPTDFRISFAPLYCRSSWLDPWGSMNRSMNWGIVKHGCQIELARFQRQLAFLGHSLPGDQENVTIKWVHPHSYQRNLLHISHPQFPLPLYCSFGTKYEETSECIYAVFQDCSHCVVSKCSLYKKHCHSNWLYCYVLVGKLCHRETTQVNFNCEFTGKSTWGERFPSFCCCHLKPRGKRKHRFNHFVIFFCFQSSSF